MRTPVLLSLLLLGCASEPSAVRVEIAVAGDASGIRWLHPTIAPPMRALTPLGVELGELPGAVLITDLPPGLRRISVFFEARSGDGHPLYTGATCATIDDGAGSTSWVVLQAGFAAPRDGCSDGVTPSDLGAPPDSGAPADLRPAIDKGAAPDLSPPPSDLSPPPSDLSTGVKVSFPFSTGFEVPDGSDWPEAFVPLGTGAAAYDVMGGRGRLVSYVNEFASMDVPALRSRDFSVTATFALEDPTFQGVGGVVRNDGRPAGNGYGWFLHPTLPDSFELWRRVDGVATVFAAVASPVAVTAGQPFRVRLEAIQSGAMTILRAKLWRADVQEPAGWTLEVVDSTLVLQDQVGSPSLLAINYPGVASGADHVYFDDVTFAQP